MTLRVLPGDVGFAQGTGLLQRTIRHTTRGPREEKTWANHALMFTHKGAVGPVPRAEQAWAVEALWRVEHNPWWERHESESGYRIRIYRPDFVMPTEMRGIVQHALEHEGERYGWWKLGTHLLDRVLFDDKKVLSSFLRVDSRPICSYLVARAFEEEGYRYAFGDIPPVAQDPDEMMDHTEKTSWMTPAQIAAQCLAQWSYVGETRIP
jgi:hypothetical protein